MPTHTLLAAAGVLLLAAGTVPAITVSNSNTYVPVNFLAGDYSGVAELMIVRPDLGAGLSTQCSGALLSDGFSILTAAHCIADGKGTLQATEAYVTFALPEGSYTSFVASFDVNPLYAGGAESPYDIAVLTLTTVAPASAARYGLYVGTVLGETVTLAGYGLGGSGTRGYDEARYPFGTLRVGENQYDAIVDEGELVFDFDDGTEARDALGGLGLDNSEAFLAPGDDGGPSFIAGQIVGVHASTARKIRHGRKTDADKILNSSYGEYGRDVSVIHNAAFVQSLLAATPEPKAMALVGVALIAISLMGGRRRRR